MIPLLQKRGDGGVVEKSTFFFPLLVAALVEGDACEREVEVGQGPNLDSVVAKEKRLRRAHHLIKEISARPLAAARAQDLSPASPLSSSPSPPSYAISPSFSPTRRHLIASASATTLHTSVGGAQRHP